MVIRYMLDANVFDYILDHGLDPASVKSIGDLYVTSIQRSELLKVSDTSRRANLLLVLDGVAPTEMHISPGVWLDSLHWDDQAIWKDEPGALARELYGSATRSEKWKDATIGEAAKLGGCVLISDDRDFRKRARKHGISASTSVDALGHLKQG